MESLGDIFKMSVQLKNDPLARYLSLSLYQQSIYRKE
jgi:hypothetical protein